MAWWNPFKPSPPPAPAPSPPKQDAPLLPGQQGPVRPQPVYQGPQQPGKEFGSGGSSVPIGSGGGGSSGGSSSAGTSTSIGGGMSVDLAKAQAQAPSSAGPAQNANPKPMNYQEKAIQAEGVILASKGLPQPTLAQKQQFYGGVSDPFIDRLAKAKVNPFAVPDMSIRSGLQSKYQEMNDMKPLQLQSPVTINASPMVYNIEGVNLKGVNDNFKYFSSGTSKDIAPTINTPYSIPSKPGKTRYEFGDIFKGASGSVYNYPSGSLTLKEQQDIVGGSNGGLFPGPIIGQIRLAKAQRESQTNLEYKQALDINKINTAWALASPTGTISDTTITKGSEWGFKPSNIFKFQNPFRVETTSASTSYPNADLGLVSSRLTGQGIKVNYDKTTTTDGDITSTQFTNIKYSSPALDTSSLSPFGKIYQERLSAGKSTLPVTAASIITNVGEKALKGTALTYGLEYTGALAGLQYTAVALPGRIVSTSETLFGTNAGVNTAVALTKVGNIIPKIGYGLGGGYMAFEGISGGIRGYSGDNPLGITGTKGAVYGATYEAGGVAGFFVGASKGELSPIQIQPIVTNKGTMETTTYSLGLVNPFGRQGFALGTYTKGEGVSLGAFKPQSSPSFMAGGEMEVGGQLGLQSFRNSLPFTTNAAEGKELLDIAEKTIPTTQTITSPGTPKVDLSNTKWYGKLNPEAQKVLTSSISELAKGSGKFTFSGLGTAIKEGAAGGLFSGGNLGGMERTFGTLSIRAEGGITRAVGDVDINVYGNVIPKIENIAGRLNQAMPGQFSVSEGKLSFNGEKIIEGFGQDVPSELKNPLAYKNRLPRAMNLQGGEDIAGQKLGESITQKFSTSLTLKGSPEGLSVGPRAGQEKVLGDIYKMMGRASELSTKNSGVITGLQTRYKAVAFKMNPNIDFESGTIGGTTTLTKMSSVAPSTITFASTQPQTLRQSMKGISSSGSSSFSSVSNLRLPVFDSSKSSSSSSSLPSSFSSFSSKPSSSSSLSSRSSIPSSFSSKSSSSSVSSLSSSISSLSSLSSKSSSSSSSSSSLSSLSSFSGFNLPKLKLDFGERNFVGGTKARTRRKYTPSYDALIRNIRGKAPKSGAVLALGTRPITKGFKFSFSGGNI